MSAFALISIGAYGLIGLGFWRTMTGHFAWQLHNSARTKRKDHPAPEDWFGAAIVALIPGIIWPLVLLMALPWPFRSQVEVEGERQAQQTRMRRLTLENERRWKELNK